MTNPENTDIPKKNVTEEELAFCGTRSFKGGCQKVAYGVSAHFCRVKTPSIAILKYGFFFGYGTPVVPEIFYGNSLGPKKGY